MERFLRSQILWELDAIRFTSAPLFLPEETREFVHTIPDSTNSEGVTLHQFLMSLPRYSIRDGAIGQLLSPEIRNLLAKHADIARQKEDAVAAQHFDIARQHRDAQRLAFAELQQMVPTPINIAPVDIVQLLRALGFDGPLPLAN